MGRINWDIERAFFEDTDEERDAYNDWVEWNRQDMLTHGDDPDTYDLSLHAYRLSDDYDEKILELLEEAETNRLIEEAETPDLLGL